MPSVGSRVIIFDSLIGNHSAMVLYSSESLSRLDRAQAASSEEWQISETRPSVCHSPERFRQDKYNSEIPAKQELLLSQTINQRQLK